MYGLTNSITILLPIPMTAPAAAVMRVLAHSGVPAGDCCRLGDCAACCSKKNMPVIVRNWVQDGGGEAGRLSRWLSLWATKKPHLKSEMWAPASVRNSDLG